LQILANPWSPPGWMKANDALTNNYPGGSLLPASYQALASYFVKFLRDYAYLGVQVNSITPQNEPSVEITYPSLGFPEHDQASFIYNDLAPALAAARLSTKIYGADDAWGLSQDADALASSAAGKDLAGIAWHCYFGSPTVMSQLHLAQPSLDQIVSECSPEIRPTVTGEYLISAFRNWASAALVWNVALESTGGPVQPPNSGCHGCTGVITINPQTHRARFSRKYYQLGQVSKYVAPGAVRISSTNFVSYGLFHGFSVTSPGLDDVAFLNPDGSKVLVTYNNGSATRFAVRAGGRYFTDRLAPGAMATFVWDQHR
jgi:glucosylceramidase